MTMATNPSPGYERKPRPRCDLTSKVIFTSYGEARARLLSIQEAPESGRIFDHYRPVSVTERCDGCDGYHLTCGIGKKWASGKNGRKNPKRRQRRRR
jgi:hypothetical protein